MDRPALTHKCGETEIRWTYGLQNDLQRVVPDVEQVIGSLSDPYVRDYLIRRALTPVKKTITNDDELIKVEDVEITPDETLDLLDWISGHLLSFLAVSAGNMSRRGVALKEALPQLHLSTTGLPASA